MSGVRQNTTPAPANIRREVRVYTSLDELLEDFGEIAPSPPLRAAYAAFEQGVDPNLGVRLINITGTIAIV